MMDIGIEVIIVIGNQSYHHWELKLLLSLGVKLLLSGIKVIIIRD